MVRRCVGIACAIAIASYGAPVVHAADGSASGFQMNATAATTATTAHSADGNRFALAASIAAGPVVPAPALTGTRFRIDAVAAAASLVCYNDTIFRDDFDGDGF